MYPLDIQRDLWNFIPPSKLPVRPASVASLVHTLIQVNKRQPEVGTKWWPALCHIVHRVCVRLGGTREVFSQDFSGCQRFPRTDKSHLCPGSHCDRTCPQALSSSSPGYPAFKAVYEMVKPERLMEQCRMHHKDDHDPATCAAQHHQYAKCGNCRTYILNVVYPRMYLVLIQLLNDPTVGEDDKHAYRVQLASGLLSVAWGQYPPAWLAPLAKEAVDLSSPSN